MKHLRSMRISTYLFDFHGVLCEDRFYAPIMKRNPGAYEWIQTNLFRGKHPILQSWMRGEVSFQEVNAMIAKNTDIKPEELNNLFVQGVKEMKVNMKLLNHISILKCSGAKIGLVTDNMDVFSSVFVPHKRLSRYFDVIINSSDYGIMKEDNNGQLFDVALQWFGESDFSKCMFVDDTKSATDLFHSKGGHVHHYANLEQYLESVSILA